LGSTVANTVSPAVQRLLEGLLGLGMSLLLRGQFRLQPLVLGAKMGGRFDGFVTGEVGMTDLGLEFTNRCLRLGQDRSQRWRAVCSASSALSAMASRLTGCEPDAVAPSPAWSRRPTSTTGTSPSRTKRRVCW
jgi:hypothetical protein